MKTGLVWFGEESPLLVQPSLAKAIGLHEAIFVQQLDYWLQRGLHIRDERKWIYNTYEEWSNQLPFMSVRTIKWIVSNLRKKGIIETTDRYNQIAVDRTFWYTLCYETLQKRCGISHSANLALFEVAQVGHFVTPGRTTRHSEEIVSIPKQPTLNRICAILPTCATLKRSGQPAANKKENKKNDWSMTSHFAP